MNKNLLFYIVALSIFGAGIVLILGYGSRINRDRTVVENTAEPGPANPTPSQPDKPVTPLGYIDRALGENLRSSTTILLLQIIVILITARLFCSIFLKFGQPGVI